MSSIYYTNWAATLEDQSKQQNRKRVLLRFRFLLSEGFAAPGQPAVHAPLWRRCALTCSGSHEIKCRSFDDWAGFRPGLASKIH